MEYRHKDCPDFDGRYVCDHFIENGACRMPSRFMCHIYMETKKRPVEDDVPLFVGEVLKTFEGSQVVASKDGRVITKETPIDRQKKWEAFLGKI